MGSGNVSPQFHIARVQLTAQSTHSFSCKLRGNQGLVRLRRNEAFVWERCGRDERFLRKKGRGESRFGVRRGKDRFVRWQAGEEGSVGTR